MRKHLLTTVIVAVALLALSPTAARADGSRPFGLGLMVGSPTGLSGKLYLGNRTAVAMGVGEAFGHRYEDDGLHLHVDFLWHPAMLAQNNDFFLPLHIGVGGRILDHEGRWWEGGRWYYYDDHTHLGVRMPVGLTMDFRKVPLDVFFELALVANVIVVDEGPYDDLYDHDLLSLTGALGARYYF